MEKTGAAVTIVENGLQCTELFTGSAKGSFDAILMDIQMPVMNGYEAAQAIRSSTHPQSATIPIIAMTANAFAEDIKNALSAGMNAQLPNLSTRKSSMKLWQLISNNKKHCYVYT